MKTLTPAMAKAGKQFRGTSKRIHRKIYPTPWTSNYSRNSKCADFRGSNPHVEHFCWKGQQRVGRNRCRCEPATRPNRRFLMMWGPARVAGPPDCGAGRVSQPRGASSALLSPVLGWDGPVPSRNIAGIDSCRSGTKALKSFEASQWD